MNTKELTPPAVRATAAPDESGDAHESLQWEANRLLEFKKEKVKRNHTTPCPACATYVHINANKCPHCGSDIAANNALVRESLRRLEEITAQLETMHEQHMERLHGGPRRPISERLKGFFTDPQTKEDMKIVLPIVVLFFAAVGTFRAVGLATLFWVFSIAGGAIAYTLLSRLNVKRLVTIDLYRSVLVLGLSALIVSAVAQPLPLNLGDSRERVEVIATTANIRQSSTTQAAVVGTVHQGERLVVIERSQGWFKVRTEGGHEGWVHTSLVR